MVKIIEKSPILSLTILVILMLLIHLDIPNITIMEARNFITSREMIQDNHWILTTMNGEPRYQKPPLPTWLTAISGLIFGVNSLFALRLPAALMVLFSGIFCYYFSLKLKLSKNHSFRNSLILVTSFYVIAILNEAPWDIYAHGFMLAGIYYLFKLLSESNQIWKNVILAAIFFSFSMLSKGPVSLFALFLPFIIAYGITYKFSGVRQKSFPLIAFVVLFLALGSSWFIYVRFADPQAFLEITNKETGNWSSYNVKPFYYYWSFFTQSGLWTLPAFVGLLYPYLIKRVESKKVYKFTFLWTIIAVILLSLIPEKKPRYLMPVLIPLALNTGFYIQYLIKKFSTVTNKKETIPVYFNFGLIATIGLIAPIALYIVLKEGVQEYLVNYVLTSLSLLIIGFFIFKNLRNRKFKNVFYLTISFMAAVFIFGLPISKFFNKNEAFKSLATLHTIEKQHNIETYAVTGVSPEMIWDYNGKIKDIYKNDVIVFPNSDKFGLLLPEENIDKAIAEFSNIYNFTFIETFNSNVGSKNKPRLIRKLYILKLK